MKKSFRNNFQVTKMNSYHLICLVIEKASILNMLFIFNQKTKKKRYNKGCTGAIVLYLSKAFDTINEVLIVKIYANGFYKKYANGFYKNALKFIHD